MEEEARFEAMYREHCGAVRSFVHRRVPTDRADEIVAEVFLAAWRRWDDAPENSLVWLFGIARGLIANQRRGDARRQALHDRLKATATHTSELGPESQAGQIDAVLRALATLSEHDQDLLRLVAWEDLDCGQVAGVLGINPRLMPLRLHRARRRLALAIARDEGADARTDSQSHKEVFR